MNRLVFVIACCFLSVALPAVADEPTIDIDEFNRWIFGDMASPNDSLSILEQRCDLSLTRISQTLNLRDDQKERLRLAGKGDIQRFYSRVEVARRNFLALNSQAVDHGDGLEGDEAAFENSFEDAYAMAEPLRRDLRNGLFGQGSLFDKVAANALDDDQRAALEQQSSQLLEMRTRNAVRTFVAKLGWHIPLTSIQRAKLTDVLLQNKKPVVSAGPLTFHVVLCRFGEVPREQYETFFDEHQMKVIAHLLQQVDDLRDHLEQEGLIDDES